MTTRTPEAPSRPRPAPEPSPAPEPAADDPICLGPDGPVSWSAFAGDVAAMQDRLGDADVVLNMAGDRYAFIVGLAAAMASGRATALPGSTAPKALAAALEGAASPIVLGEGREAEAATGARLVAPPDPAGKQGDAARLRAALAASQAEIRVFTSGSTGAPKRIVKSWRMLAGGAEVTRSLLSLAGLDPARSLVVGTTPQQHMYGLEATVFTALACRSIVDHATVFFPADLEAAVSRAAAAGLGEVALATSPAHLKYLEPVIMAEPAIRAIISATAPFPRPLAERLEARGGLQVLEIYGSSETGSIAGRRTARDAAWTLMAGATLTAQGDGHAAEAPHLDGSWPLGDIVRPLADGRFDLLGRAGDLVNVAGKRTSLGALNAAIVECTTIADGVILLREGANGDELGLAVVRLPGDARSEEALRAEVRRHLAAYFDAVFLPRSMRIIPAIRRGPTGKIPAEELDRIAREAGW